MRRLLTLIMTLNRFFSVILLLVLLLTMAIGTLSWLSVLQERSAVLRESRFQFTLNNIKSALESSLQVGLMLSDLPGAQQLIEQNRMQESVIESIDIFNAEGHIIFSTDTDGVGANIPKAWRNLCLNNDKDPRSNVSSQDEEGHILCAPVLNSYEKIAGGVALRYRLPDRVGMVGLLGNTSLLILALFMLLLLSGTFIGWLLIHPIERRLDRQTTALQSHDLSTHARNDSLSGKLASAQTVVHQMHQELDNINREADRLDNLEAR